MKYIVMSAFAMGMTFFSQGALACSQEDAMTKMTKIVQSQEYLAFVSSAETAEEAEKVAAVAGQLNTAGGLLGEQKLEEACAEYDSIIEELGIEE